MQNHWPINAKPLLNQWPGPNAGQTETHAPTPLQQQHPWSLGWPSATVRSPSKHKTQTQPQLKDKWQELKDKRQPQLKPLAGHYRTKRSVDPNR